MKKFIALVLSFALCFTLAVPTYAANESNTMGITFSATLDQATLAKSDTEQTVVLTVVSSAAVETSSISYTANIPEGLTLTSLEGDGTNVTGATTNLENAQFSWSASGGVAISVSTIAKVTVKVPAGTEAGTYEIGVSGIQLSKDSGMTIIEDGASAAATLTITDGSTEVTDSYTVEVENSSNDLVAVGGSVALNVNVNNAFNSTKMTLSYDTNYLTFVNGAVASNQTMGDSDQAVSITGNNGVITIIDYGTAFAAGNAYTLNFTAAAATTGTDVGITYAGLSTAEEAKDSDLTAATSLEKVSVPVGYTVTVPAATNDYSFTASASAVVPGGSVNITVNNPYYDYVLSATGGTLTSTTTGWTVSNVTGNVTVSVTSATPKKFDVTVKTVDEDGNAIDGFDDVVTTDGATYGTAYSYTLPDDTAASTTAGVQYTLKSITVSGTNATYTTSNRTYTIAGENVTGDIVVTIIKQDLDPNAFTVSMEGETSAATLEPTQVAKNGTAKLTLTNKETGYTYTVTATMGGSSVTPAQSGDEYTVSNVTGNVVFTVSKSLDTSVVTVTQYVQLDNAVMWLVKVGSAQITDKTYTYTASEGATAEKFFWSSKYGTYCFLVVTDTNTDADTVKTNVASKIGLTNATAVAISYNGNVNLTTDSTDTAVIDVNDAQLVWNMYSAVYSDTGTVSIQKFLEADMDTAVGLSTGDAAAVVALIQ